MPISDHYKGGMTERLAVQIITCDPTTGRLEGVGKDAAVIQIGVSNPPALFVWPNTGEYWIIVRENGTWTLEGKIQNPDDKSILALDPGEALVQANTIWTPDGEHLIRTGDAAGGVLSGSYPNPGFAVDMATQSELDSVNTTLGGRITPLEGAVGRIINVQTMSGASEAYSAVLSNGGATLLDRPAGAGALAMTLSYTPPVNCWWEVNGGIGIVEADTAAYAYIYGALALNPTDVDGVNGAYTLATQHSTVDVFLPRTMSRLFKLSAGTAYTVSLSLFGGQAGGTWRYYCGTNQLWIGAKAITR